MEDFEILSERKQGAGWSFSVATAGGGQCRGRRLTLRLAWADYNHLSADGGDPPHRVAEAVLRFLLGRSGAEAIPQRFDASLARRRFSDADAEIPKLIRR